MNFIEVVYKLYNTDMFPNLYSFKVRADRKKRLLKQNETL